MGEKTFNLTWNNHLANLSGLFEGLYKSGSLTDTTLACQGGMLRAHRLVLAACSPYFERVFKEHYGEQPIFILKGVAVEEMECLLDFMYRGSINVTEEHLPSLIKTATDLEIRGLSGDHRNDNNSMYLRADSRGQPCQVETRLHSMDFRKAQQQVSFLTKPLCGNSMAGVKLEEIEVEDDPMIMEGHEDSYDEPLAKDQIRRIPPPMYKRSLLFGGSQQRALAGKSIYKEQEIKRPVDPMNDESFETELQIDNFKLEDTYNTSTDPTVPAIQMNDDSMDQGRSGINSPSNQSSGTAQSLEKSSHSAVSDINNKTVNANDGGKERKKVVSKSKAQYKPFPCDLCTLAFTRASHLARHRRVHTGERPFACTMCPRMFARQDKLKQHLDSHMQWPKRKSMAAGNYGLGVNPSATTPSMITAPTTTSPVTTIPADSASFISKGKRGRPRKINTRTSVTRDESTGRDD